MYAEIFPNYGRRTSVGRINVGFRYPTGLNMITRLLVLVILTGLLKIPPVTLAATSNIEDVADVINKQLESTSDPKTIAKLYCFRARSYAEQGDLKKAKNDYLRALEASYEGWILNELGFFMFNIGEFEKAYNVSTRVINDFPHLQEEATKLQLQAKKKWEEEYLKNNPPTIELDSVPDPHRVTRHDLLNQQNKGSNQKKTKSSSPGKPISEHWGKHPATKHIPVPERKRMDY
jgi:tetratricopeptide (TPR) repeat protein